MGNGIYVATSGATARARQIETVANNVANAGTAGYRKVEVGFEEVLRDARAPNRHHVAVTEPRLSTEQGPLEQTGRPMDLALSGPGYFVFDGDNGNALLRRTVSLRVTEDGALVDDRNRALKTEWATKIDPRLRVQIDAHGVIHQEGASVGRVEIRGLFNDEQALEPVGGGAYLTTPRSGEGVVMQTGDVVSGALEGSNVAPVESMVRLITLERDFQSLTKVIHAYREADDALVNTANRNS